MKRTWVYWLGWAVTFVALWEMPTTWYTWGILGVALMATGIEERKR